MCQWKETGEAYLYAHDSCGDKVFFHTRQGQPLSLTDGFHKTDFVLVFTGRPVEKEAVKKLKEALDVHGAEQPGCFLVFIEKDILPRENWQQLPLKLGADGGVFSLGKSVTFSVGEYALELKKKSVLSVLAGQDGAEQLQISAAAPGSGGADYGAEFLRDGGLACRMKRCLLLMEGKSAGCFSFTAAGTVTMESLRAGIWYGLQREAPVRGREIDAFFDQALEPDFPIKELEVRLDVLNPLDKERSFFWLPKGRWRTNFPIYLSPENLELETEEREAKLVFSRRRTEVKLPAYRYYLTFDGAFTIKSPAGSLCAGLSGQEYVDFEADSRLYFVSGKQAYFPLQEQSFASGLPSGDTAYVALEKGVYYSQAQDCAFYAMSNEAGVLDYAEIPFQKIGKDDCFPLLPVGTSGGQHGAAKKQQTYDAMKALDERRLAALRNRMLGARPLSLDGMGEAMKVLSTKGLYLTQTPGKDYFDTLEFCEKFRFAKVSGFLKQALMASHAFLVIDNAEEFSKYASVMPESPPLCIDGWTFSLDSAGWKDNQTFLLLKYTSHKSIRALADAPAEWSYPPDTGDLRGKGAASLQAILKALDEVDKENAAFDDLRAILEDPLWCGTIAFSVPVEGNQLPDNLKFLLRLREGGKLLAHHMIFESRSLDEKGILSPGQISGIIAYEDPKHPILTEPWEFYYKLDQLQVVFRQSQVLDFSCRLSLTLQYFLGSPLFAVGGSCGNYMIVTGRMAENQDAPGVSDYLFELAERIEYFTDNAFYSGLCVDKVTLTSSAAEERASFFLAGRLKFVLLDSDVLSYGDPKPDPKAMETESGKEDTGLVFSDLLLLEKKGSIAVHTGTMKYHYENSVPRAGSLAEQFPIHVTEFLTGSAGVMPESLGYAGIQADGIHQEALADTWSAVCWQIDLGDLGALSTASNLKLSLLTAWSVGEVDRQGDGGVTTGAASGYIGAKLGNFQGVSGMVPLEGILSLGFDSVELKRSAAGEFYLHFRDFSLKFLKYTFPSGNNDIYLFPGPDRDGKLGWYAAYEKEGEKNHVY